MGEQITLLVEAHRKLDEEIEHEDHADPELEGHVSGVAQEGNFGKRVVADEDDKGQRECQHNPVSDAADEPCPAHTLKITLLLAGCQRRHFRVRNLGGGSGRRCALFVEFCHGVLTVIRCSDGGACSAAQR